MAVYNRIKLIEFSNLTDAELKVNDFFSSQPDLCQLVDIYYYWEDKLIVLEYIVHKPECIAEEEKELCGKCDDDKNILKKVWNVIHTSIVK